MQISKDIQQKLLCPETKGKLKQNGEYLVSVSNTNIHYPIIDSIPILINNKKSLFSISDFVTRKDTHLIKKKQKKENY